MVAYLQRRAAQRQVRLERALALHRGSPVERILHLYDLLAVELAEPGYRGSPFANACVELGAEHPAAAVAREHRQWLLDAFTGLATEAAAPDPAALAAQLLLLYEAAAAGRRRRRPHGQDRRRRLAGRAHCAAAHPPGAPPRDTSQAAARRRSGSWRSSTAPTCPTATTSWPTTAPGRGSRAWLADACRPRLPRSVEQPAHRRRSRELLVAAGGAARARRRQLRRPSRSAPRRAGGGALERTPLLVELAAGPEPRSRRPTPTHRARASAAARRRAWRRPPTSRCGPGASGPGSRSAAPPTAGGPSWTAPATARAAGATWPDAVTGPRTAPGATVRLP